MMSYKHGDVVLVRFLFSDETIAKRRPAVIISTNDYQENRQEAIISAITSNVERVLLGDHLIGRWKEAGLLFPSLATGIIRTIKQGMIERKLGQMPNSDMEAIGKQMRQILGL